MGKIINFPLKTESETSLSKDHINTLKQIAFSMLKLADKKFLNRLSRDELFVLGFLNGYEYGLEQLGVFDDEE